MRRAYRCLPSGIAPVTMLGTYMFAGVADLCAAQGQEAAAAKTGIPCAEALSKQQAALSCHTRVTPGPGMELSALC